LSRSPSSWKTKAGIARPSRPYVTALLQAILMPGSGWQSYYNGSSARTKPSKYAGQG